MQKQLNIQNLIEANQNIVLVYQNSQTYFADNIYQFSTIYDYKKISLNANFLEQLQLEEIEQQLNFCDFLIPFNKEVKLFAETEKERWLDCFLQKTNFCDRSAILIIAKNITKYKQLDQQEAKITAEKGFISMLCHDLRNHLNKISLSSNLLNKYNDSWQPAKQKQYLSRITKGVNNLNLLIDEWMVLEKGKLGKLRIKPEDLDIKNFCSNLLTDLQLNDIVEKKSSKNTTIKKRVNLIYSGDISSVLIDRQILQLILTNLLENACKYSPKNTVVDFIVDCKLNHISFRVIDYGIGISSNDLKQLFEPFFRGKNIDNVNGNGLGLAIVKKLVNLLNGNIFVDSQVGLRTEFKVTFPRI